MSDQEVWAEIRHLDDELTKALRKADCFDAMYEALEAADNLLDEAKHLVVDPKNMDVSLGDLIIKAIQQAKEARG